MIVWQRSHVTCRHFQENLVNPVQFRLFEETTYEIRLFGRDIEGILLVRSTSKRKAGIVTVMALGSVVLNVVFDATSLGEKPNFKAHVNLSNARPGASRVDRDRRQPQDRHQPTVSGSRGRRFRFHRTETHTDFADSGTVAVGSRHSGVASAIHLPTLLQNKSESQTPRGESTYQPMNQRTHASAAFFRFSMLELLSPARYLRPLGPVTYPRFAASSRNLESHPNSLSYRTFTSWQAESTAIRSSVNRRDIAGPDSPQITDNRNSS